MNIMVLKTKITKYIASLALALSVTACASTEAVTSNETLRTAPQTIEQTQPAYKVQQLSVTVPTELSVSEANVYVPRADIVWREDPLGDRKQQVQAILANAIVQGVSKVEEGHPVTMSVRVNMFHALSEKARYTVGGRHNINFDYVLRDAETGATITEVKNVDAKFKAYGGSKAIAAMAHGETQKVRITKHIENLMYLEMTGKSEI
jgi:hypothetical protein